MATRCIAELAQNLSVLEDHLREIPVSMISVRSLGRYLLAVEAPPGDPPEHLAYRCSWLRDTYDPGKQYDPSPAFYIPDIGAFMVWLEASIPLTDEERQGLALQMTLRLVG